MKKRKSSFEVFMTFLIAFSVVLAIFVLNSHRIGFGSYKDFSSDYNRASPKLEKENLAKNEHFPSIKDKPTYEDRIFMHETSGRHFLLWRQTCSLESVASSNPDRPIHLYMSTTEVSEAETPWMDIIRQFGNIKLILINNEAYFNKSKLDDWYRKRKWQNNVYETSHMSNYIRMVTLSRSGGLYIDLDVILFKKLENEIFKNFFVYGSKHMNYIDSAVFHLNTDHRLIEKIVETIANDYRDDDRYHGSIAVEEVLIDVCGAKIGKPKFNSCKDVSLLPHTFFYPFEEHDSRLLFQEASPEFMAKVTSSYGIHTFFSSTHGEMTNLDSAELLAKLAHEYCPSTVSKALLYHDRKL